jgi:hypothetical protein
VANSDVLAAVSQTLQNRLTAGLSTLGPPVPVAEVHDLASLPSTTPPRATLFLYDVAQEPTVRNRPKSTRLVGGNLVERKQPMGLCLHYLITAWGGDRATEQQILGRVMQVMYDDAVIDGVELAGSLAGTATQLRVSLLPMQLEDRARVWSAIGQPYRLSVNYEARVVDIDAISETSLKPVLARRIDAGVPS